MRNAIRPLLFVVVSSLSSPTARAQVSELWRTSVPGGSGGAGAVDASGTVYVCGTSGTDPRITKLDAQGNLLWTTSFATPNGDFGTAIGIEADGQHVVIAMRDNSDSEIRLLRCDAAGQLDWLSAPYDPGSGAHNPLGAKVLFDAAGNSHVVGRSSNNALVLSHDAAGNFRWAATIDGAAHLSDVGFALVLDAADNAYLVGNVDENVLTSAPGSLLVAKISPAGQVLWQRTLDGAAGGHGYDIDLAPNGDVVVCGTSGSQTEALVARYDSDGNLLWSRVLSVGIPAYFHAVAVDGADAVIATGYQQTSFSSNATADVLTAKYDAAGNLVWQRLWNSPLGFGDRAFEIAVDAAGNASVGAWSDGSAVIFTPETAFALVRYDAAGNLRWSGRLPHGTSDLLLTLLQRQDGSIVLTGTSTPAAALVIALADQARAFCFGDGESGPCPCGNASAPGSASGCANSFGAGASLGDAGLASLGGDTLALTAASMPSTATTIFLQGSVEIAATSFGDGLRCVGGTLLRLYVKTASGGVATAPVGGDPSISARSAALGDPIAPGTSRYVQAYYRDPDLLFCPSPSGATWNVTNALEISWTN